MLRFGPMASIRCCVLLSLLCGSVSLASEDTIELIPVADTSSPRATLESFIDACNHLSTEIRQKKYVDRDEDRLAVSRILDCINTSELPMFARHQRGAEVAVCLKEVLDRTEIPPWDEIPDGDAVEAAGGPEKLSYWRLPKSRITIMRVEQGPQRHEYLFSPGTVDRIVEFYQDIKALPYRTDGPATTPGFHDWFLSMPGHPLVATIIDRLPDSLRLNRTLGLANWVWPCLITLLLAAFGAMLFCYRALLFYGRVTAGKRPLLHFATVVFPIAAMLIPLCLEYISFRFLSVRGTSLYAISLGSALVSIIAAAVAVFVMCGRVASLVIASPKVNPNGLNAQLIRIAARLASVALSVAVLMLGGQYLGIPVATLLASAGIGGVALALGAQDTLKTLFGTIMLMADKPFRVGERIIFRDYDGVVEDIGLRSTRLRLLSSHLVTIPNDELSRSDIENVGRRERIRRIADLPIPLDTPSDKLERSIDAIRDYLEDHEGLDEEFPPRVFLAEIGPTSFLVRVMYWYNPPDYWAYMAFSERANLSVLKILESEGIEISQTERVAFTNLEQSSASPSTATEESEPPT